MAKSQSKKPLKAEFKGFHNVNLTKEDEVLFLTWSEQDVDVLVWLGHLVDSGYKVSFDFDPYNQGHRCSLYCTQAKMAWAGYTLTAWADSPLIAFKLLIFKHDVMCKGVWEIAPEVTKRGVSSFG